MQKTYTASSELSFNVCMGTGHRHVAFVPFTRGGSALTTDDTELQDAIERHRFFGTRITMTIDDSKPAERPAKAEPEAEQVHFTSPSDAKDYVAERWGISRTQLRTCAQIAQIAAAHGVIIHFST